MNGFNGQIAAMALTAIVVFAVAAWAIGAEVDRQQRRRWQP